jgi:hypothetical protein
LWWGLTFTDANHWRAGCPDASGGRQAMGPAPGFVAWDGGLVSDASVRKEPGRNDWEEQFGHASKLAAGWEAGERRALWRGRCSGPV